MEIWTPKVGNDIWHLKCDDGNEYNKYTVAVMIEGRTGRHVPKNLSKIFNLFLTLPNCATKCKATGKCINGGARNSGPVQFLWTGESCGLGGERCKKSY